MKKIILLAVLSLALFSCSLDDDTPKFHQEILPIESVDIPDEFELGQVYEISMTYLKPSTCHQFNNFYYRINGNERTVAVITSVYTDQKCEDLEDEEVEVSFNFEVTRTDSYVFKFYQGADESGDDTYYIVEVPVAE